MRKLAKAHIPTSNFPVTFVHLQKQFCLDCGLPGPIGPGLPTSSPHSCVFFSLLLCWSPASCCTREAMQGPPQGLCTAAPSTCVSVSLDNCLVGCSLPFKPLLNHVPSTWLVLAPPGQSAVTPSGESCICWKCCRVAINICLHSSLLQLHLH